MLGVGKAVGQKLSDLFPGPIGVGQDDDAPLFMGAANLFQRMGFSIEPVGRNHIDIDLTGPDAGDVRPAFDDQDFLNHEPLLPGVRQCTGQRSR